MGMNQNDFDKAAWFSVGVSVVSLIVAIIVLAVKG